MAEDALGKTVEQLKRERTSAKSSFTRQANFLCREAHRLTESELKEEFSKFSVDARRVFETNDDYKAGLLAETEAQHEDEEAEAQLSAQQKTDFKKTMEDCNTRFDEVSELVQDNLWNRYGQQEVSAAVVAAEKACDRANGIPVSSVHYEGYGVQLELVIRMVNEATGALVNWEKWIPTTEKSPLVSQVRKLKEVSNELEARKVEFVWARRAAEDERASETKLNVAGPVGQIVPVVRIKPASLPKFSGNKRDFYSWKRDWENLQRQGEPTGSAEVKKIQLVDSIDERIAKELRLSSYNTAVDIFRVLENRYGNKITIAMEIVDELERMPAVRGNQPKRVIELIQMVEKALADLTDLGNVGAIKNPLVIKSIESKLPEFVKRDWLIQVTDPASGITMENHFDALLKFLKKEEEILERLEQLKISERAEKPEKRSYAFTKTTKKVSTEDECVVCGSEKHKGKIFFCKKFKELKLADKKSIVRRLGACKKCLGCHEDASRCSDNYLCRNKDCKKGACSDHHYFLCPKGELKVGSERKVACDKRENRLTDEQEKFLAELSPELAERCKEAFTNKVKMVNCSKRDQMGLLVESGVKELPVIMMLLEVTANAGQKVGALIDLASDTNYITHEAADRLKLRGENVTLVVHGVGKMAVKVSTKRYLLKIRVKTSNGTEKAHQLICYGLEEIAQVHKAISPEQLKRFFPEANPVELKRPEKIDLLISHREGRLAPQRVKIVGDLVLWDSPLGKTVAGAHPDLLEMVDMTAYESKTHFARSMRTAAVKYKEVLEEAEAPSELIHRSKDSHAETKISLASHHEFFEWWKWDSIGAACDPKCGGCRCGNCQPGGKEMTLVEENELEVIRGGLTYVEEDSHSKSPHWDTKYPWTQDPATLPYNRSGVEAVFLRTEKQLQKVPEWQGIYAAQVHDMIERRAAKKLTKEEIDNWKGPVWYVSHLVAPNPHSSTTPVRLVWNSSQKFRGLSMNDFLLKGPDVLNPIRAVLLRFRKGVFAALGDIKKMYNSVWLEEREMHLHRFLWRDTQEEEIGEHAITRVNIGDRPAGCIAQLAMRETARLTKFTHRKEERRVLEEDSYVDDILTSHNNKERLNEIVTGLEEILTAGGFALKPWVQSGQSGRQEANTQACSQSKTMILPNQLRCEDNKALGTGYLVEEDKLYIMVSINFSKRKKKMRTGQNLLKSEVRLGTPCPLTRRHLLSQVAGLYDPIGLVTPAKQKGAILVRKAFQETGSGSLTRQTWDKELSECLREEAIKLFEEYVELSQVKFHRSLTPVGWQGKPLGITFSDGSDKTFGAVLYLRWDTEKEVEVRLVESKAKLTPLNQKGDAVKAEICGAVFAVRLRKYFERHGRLEVERWFHLVDSQTVLGAIQRESYGYQTFFANRVGEIQKAGPATDWWWIPGNVNIADIITRGCSPRHLDEDSEWQRGPQFLRLPLEEWPMKSAAEVAADARERVNKLQRKSFSAVLTRAQAKKELQEVEDIKKSSPERRNDPTNIPSDLSICKNAEKLNLKGNFLRGTPANLVVKKLVDVEKFSNLSKLIRVIGWLWRCVKIWLGCRSQSPKNGRHRLKKNETQRAVLTVKEQEDALKGLFLAVQEGVTFPNTTLARLAVYREDSGLLVCGGRIQIFNKEKVAVPVLPYTSWVSTLLIREAHNANHEEVAGTLLRTRKKAWVIKGRRLAKKVVDSCVVCRKARAKTCQQIMGDLPLERAGPAAPFEFTTLDLFGPYEVRDEVRKRVRLKVWGIVYCCMASRAIHTDIVSDQSAEGFLLAYQRFTALRGHPRKLWSDPGSNFVGAKLALAELYKFLDKLQKVELEREAANHGTDWCWKIHPANSPHRNGAAEAAVHMVKRALHNLGGEGVFTWGEFQTFLYMAANLANERPVDARTQSREDCVEYITPNSLLLGRSGPKGDPADFDFISYPYKRLKVIQAEVNKFWKKWSQLAGPNLFIRSKWHTKERNVAVGDIVWLADQNALRSQYKLARVINVNTDDKGIVRDVNVRVFPSYPVSIVKSDQGKVSKGAINKIPATTLHRDVRRLVVLIPVEEQSGNQTEE